MYHATQYFRMAQRVGSLSFATVALAACSGNSADSTNNNLDPFKNLHDAFIAATGPLEDLNLRREDIPPVLKAAVVDPYAIPAKFECDPIRQELAELDQVLGKEQEQMDASMLISYKETPGDEESLAPKMPQLPKMPTRDVLIEKSENMAHSQAMGFIRDQTDILPFKRIIRTVTGAEQHARKVDKAKQAGLLRRAFLKGMAQAKFGSKCLAAPMPLEVNAAPLPQKP